MKFVEKSIFAKVFAISALFICGTFYAAQVDAATAATTPASSISTYAATNVSQTQATLNGAFNGGNIVMSQVRFEYGLTPSLGSFTSYQTKNTVSGNFSDTISITAGQTYYFRAMGVNANGVPGFGNTLNFQALSYGLPNVYTYAATNVGTTTATLNGAFAGSSGSTTLYFEYANNSSFIGATKTPDYVTSNPNGNFNETISGLSTNATYYFRAVAKNGAGTKTSTTPVSFSTSQTPAQTCSISNFYASPSNVNYGSSTTLYYNTSNCTYVSIDNGVGTVSNGNNSANTGALYNNTTFTITAYGNGGSTQTSTAYVTVGNTNNNTCVINSFYASPSVVNSGSSTTLYWSTSNCNSVYLSTYGSSGTSGSWNTPAIYGTISYTLNAYGNNGSPSQTLTVSTNYNPNPCTYNCNPCTYNCYPDPVDPPTPQIIYVYGGTNYYDTSYNVASVGDALSLSIDSGFPYIYPSDIFTYAIKYKNISSRNVNNAELSVDLPREVELVGYSTGVTSNDRRTITVSLGTLSPGESGVVNLDVRADNFLSKNDRVLAKASLTGEFSNGDRTTVSDYSIVSIKGGKNPLLSASAIFGENGFLPYTFGGWLLLIALIAVIIFVGKMLYERRKNVNAYGAHTVYSAYPTNNDHDRNAHH